MTANIKRRHYLLGRTLAVAILVGSFALASPATATRNPVLPPSAKPHGYSLTRMAAAVAVFSSSGNQAAYYPKTPFQILYKNNAGNTFVVKRGTRFYVPLFNVDDSPPVFGTFPTTAAQARKYFFDPAQIGGQGFQIVVDGVATPLDASYLAGPVTSAPLLDGGGTHTITIGAFLRALRPGVHTVTISGGLFGALVDPSPCPTGCTENITYTVEVLRHR